MVTVAGILSSFILALLSILHFHWALGGTFGFEKSLPTNEEGKRILNPKKRDSAIVGSGLMFFAIMYLIKSGLIVLPLPSMITASGLWIIIVIFSLRAIGDFKYIGFLKKVKTTDFAKMDTQFYSPLCLFLVIMALIIEFNI